MANHGKSKKSGLWALIVTALMIGTGIVPLISTPANATDIGGSGGQEGMNGTVSSFLLYGNFSDEMSMPVKK